MGTITYKDIVDECVARNGEHYPEEGSRFDVMKIVHYTSPEGDPDNWGFVFRCEVAMGMGDRYDEETDVIRNPEVIFVRKE
jgi:hypothetical protein